MQATRWRGPGEQVLLTLWIGGLWIVGYLVAPTLFTALDDRATAGMLAGRMFTAMSYLGLFAGGLLLLGQWSRHGLAWRTWLLIGMLILIAVGQFLIQPMMVELKAAGLPDDLSKSEFGMLHGISSTLYLINSLLGLALVVAGLESRD